MAVDKNLWQRRFKVLPSWPCPTCRAGRLVEIEGSSLVEETPRSIEAHQFDEWDPDWIEKRFSVHHLCSDKSCGERVVVAGTVRTDYENFYEHDGSTGTNVWDWYHPAVIEPAPSIIRLSDDVPPDVAQEIRRASSLYWLDLGATATKLRSAVEVMMTALGVKRTVVSQGKRKPISLANRIDLAKQKYPAVVSLHSVRWLGNVGTHDDLDSLARDDLLDCFEIVEHVIEEIYDKRGKRVKQKAREIEKRKGRKRVVKRSSRKRATS